VKISSKSDQLSEHRRGRTQQVIDELVTWTQ